MGHVTYIRLEIEFVYLAVVLDAFSRRVIGWAPERHPEDDRAIAALEMAFRRRARLSPSMMPRTKAGPRGLPRREVPKHTPGCPQSECAEAQPGPLVQAAFERHFGCQVCNHDP